MTADTTLGQWIEQARCRLANAEHAAADPLTARLDAELLAGYITGRSRASLFAFPEIELPAKEVALLESLLERRCQGEPLAYLTGQREFWSLPLQLSAGALIPRPDTEILVEQALARLAGLNEGCIIELGTGSGAIALALAHEISERTIIAIEKYSAALQVASNNIRRFGHDRIQLIQSSWLDCIGNNTAALIISNPPYLASDDPHLPSLQYEPHSALISGKTGLEDIEHIIVEAGRVGIPGSLLLLEHGNEQGSAVRALLERYNFGNIQTEPDLAGHERVSLGYLLDEQTSRN